MKILFLLGWHSVPGGVKPTYLQDNCREVINPKLDDNDFGAALATAQAAFDLHQPDCVVGSSRGGACKQLVDGSGLPMLEIDSKSDMNNSDRGQLRIGETGSVQTECTYICDACGEEIVIPVSWRTLLASVPNKKKITYSCPRILFIPMIGATSGQYQNVRR